MYGTLKPFFAGSNRTTASAAMQASYGTTSTEHPSVAELFADLGKFYAGGRFCRFEYSAHKSLCMCYIYIYTCIWQRLKNIGLVTGPGGLFATRLVTESVGLATNPPCDKPIEDYSSLHRGP